MSKDVEPRRTKSKHGNRNRHEDSKNLESQERNPDFRGRGSQGAVLRFQYQGTQSQGSVSVPIWAGQGGAVTVGIFSIIEKTRALLQKCKDAETKGFFKVFLQNNEKNRLRNRKMAFFTFF